MRKILLLGLIILSIIFVSGCTAQNNGNGQSATYQDCVNLENQIMNMTEKLNKTCNVDIDCQKYEFRTTVVRQECFNNYQSDVNISKLFELQKIYYQPYDCNIIEVLSLDFECKCVENECKEIEIKE